MAPHLVMETARRQNRKIIPVDSEHQAVYHLLKAHGRENLEKIILTASGGPFRSYSMEQLKNVTVKQALSHPTWSMGPKISIDSASLANKGLEVIEAARLFDIGGEKINVVIHPQSIVHSMIKLKTGSIYAQLSKPDMRLPIQSALFDCDPPPSEWGELSFDDLTLTFEKPDTERFPMLPLAWEAIRRGGLYPAVYNAANEAAVDAFIKKRIKFIEISQKVEYAIERDWLGSPLSIRDVLETDREVRKLCLY
jgi:1-deoxy-D-xylulose-5-phosphate reductoisomerase